MKARLASARLHLAAHPLGLQTIVLGVLFLVGVAGHVLAPFRPLMLAITPWFLLLTGAASLALAWPDAGQPRFRLILWLLGAYAVTLSAEIIGVATGLVFGDYHYGSTLGLALMGVPVVIGFNWVLVILAGVSLFDGRPRSRWYAPPAAALMATAFDWIMEPVAMRLDYWQWAGGEIPLQNYLAWFLLGLVVAASWSALGLRLKRRSLVVLMLIEAAFFAALRLLL